MQPPDLQHSNSNINLTFTHDIVSEFLLPLTNFYLINHGRTISSDQEPCRRVETLQGREREGIFPHHW